jgi:hypothetical protein
MAKKKKDIQVFEGDICQEPTNDILDGLLNDLPTDDIESEKDFMDGIIQDAQEALNKDPGTENNILIPGSPAQVLSNVQGVMNIKVNPGSSLSNAIANPVENDKLVAAIRDNKSTSTVLKTVMEEIAEEAAYIKAWRNDNWASGEDTSDATFKRIKMLKSLVETLVEQEKLKKESVAGKVDFHGEPFKKVLKYFLETLQATFRKVHIPEQYEDIFFTELAKAFENFEKVAERLYYGKE